jgi:hypothetical protein
MRKVVKENQVFEKSIKTREEARAYFEGKGQKFKVERLGTFPEGEAISFYQNGEFVDLCARPARDAHGQREGVQAAPRRERLLPRQREEPAVAAHLRHGLQEQGRSSRTG